MSGLLQCLHLPAPPLLQLICLVPASVFPSNPCSHSHLELIISVFASNAPSFSSIADSSDLGRNEVFMVFPGSNCSLNHSASSVLDKDWVINVFRPKDIKYDMFSSPTLTQKCFISDQAYLIFKKSVLPHYTSNDLGIIYTQSCLGHFWQCSMEKCSLVFSLFTSNSRKTKP